MSSIGKDAEKWKFSLSRGMDMLQPFWKIASLQPIKNKMLHNFDVYWSTVYKNKT